MKIKYNTTCVVISGCWPGNKKGYEIACNSTLSYISAKYQDVIYIGPEDEHFTSSFRSTFTNVKFVAVDFLRKGQARRFIESIFSRFPAICMRFKRSSKEVKNILDQENVDGCDFFYEDIPAGYFLKEFKTSYTNSRHIVRSHNTVYKGFYGMKEQGNIFSRLAWTFELMKIKRLEQFLSRSSDHFISISRDDERYYKDIDIQVGSVLGVFFSPSNNDTISCHKKNLIHIGTADMRKGASLRQFVDEVWPAVYQRFPDLKFYIAGKGTEILNDPNNGVIALGFIENEDELFSKGNIFINPQLEGAGIKIKSLVALQNKCCLISTIVGVEGIGVCHGRTALVTSGFEGMSEQICLLLSDNKKMSDLSTQGHLFFMNNFTKKSFFDEAEIIWKKV